MPDSDRRKKMISVRLSEVEYEILKKHYRTYGARNVSDLARLALQRIMTGSAGAQGGFAVKLAELDERIQQLESDVALLSENGRKQCHDPGPAVDPAAGSGTLLERITHESD